MDYIKRSSAPDWLKLNEYTLLHTNENDGETESKSQSSRKKRVRRMIIVLLSLLALIFIFITIVILLSFSKSRPESQLQSYESNNEPFKPPRACLRPSKRHEWRSLNTAQQSDYIRAVKCLANHPSRVRSNGTLYDDFPWIHARVGAFSHHAAPFLSWHRYFLHAFETTLRDVCGYRGVLTYWDWSLDWENMTNSAIFDPKLGFGGDGNRTGEVSVGEGSCVVDGPFAGLQAMFYGPKDRPHCLSRGFTDGNGRNGIIPGDQLHPEKIKEILGQDTFKKFFLALEKGPHDAIPNAIRGDFYSFTAPYDPIFYLHHTQLDRLWWTWQEIDPKRHYEYSGPAAMGSDREASVYDQLPMDGYVKSVRVIDILNTKSDILCYHY